MPLTQAGQDQIEPFLNELLSAQILRQAELDRTVEIGPDDLNSASIVVRVRLRNKDRWAIRWLSSFEIRQSKFDLLAETVRQLGEELDKKP